MWPWLLWLAVPTFGTYGYALYSTGSDVLGIGGSQQGEQSAWLLQQQGLLQEERKKEGISSIINLGIVVVVGYVILQK